MSQHATVEHSKHLAVGVCELEGLEETNGLVHCTRDVMDRVDERGGLQAALQEQTVSLWLQRGPQHKVPFPHPWPPMASCCRRCPPPPQAHRCVPQAGR